MRVRLSILMFFLSLPVTAQTVTQFLKASDLGYTYVQGMTLIDNVLWGNGGRCCPGIGDSIGECLFSINYSADPPQFREWWCTYRDTTELWESGSVQVAHSDRYKWVVAGQATRRPAVPALQDAPKAAMIWGFGTNSLTDPWFSWAHSVGHNIFTGFWQGQIWPQGVLDLGGIRYLYAQTLRQWGEPMYVRRWVWSDGGHIAYWDSQFVSAPMFEGIPGIAIDKDGSLIAANGWWPEQTNTVVGFLRSKDEGRTWKDAGFEVRAPAGRTLFGCGWDHKSGGAATQPLHLVCTYGTGQGPDTGDWSAADIRFPGVVVSAAWGKKPVKVTP